MSVVMTKASFADLYPAKDQVQDLDPEEDPARDQDLDLRRLDMAVGRGGGGGGGLLRSWSSQSRAAICLIVLQLMPQASPCGSIRSIGYPLA